MESPAPGTLFLIPLPIHDDGSATIPKATLEVLSEIRFLIAERARTARRWIRRLCPEKDISSLVVFELDKHRPGHLDEAWLQPALEGQHIGLVSEAGCPGIADPGAHIVFRAQERGIPVTALAGPSSLFMALMGSGLNGQSFAFHGYLAPKRVDLQADLLRLERMAIQSGQTQIFIETPYRNQNVFETALSCLKPTTLLAVAYGLTGPHSLQITRTVGQWKQKEWPTLDQEPAVFLLGTRPS